MPACTNWGSGEEPCSCNWRPPWSVTTRGWTTFSGLPPWVRVAVEFRHDSWLDDEVFALLERHRAAYCVMSGAGLPCVLRATAPLVYVRLHGPDNNSLYGGSYSDSDLHWWADRMAEWRAAGHHTYAYFNNDGGGNAVRNARYLRDLVGPASNR